MKRDPDRLSLPGREDETESDKAGRLRALATVQAEAGDVTTSRATFDQAVSAVGGIADDRAKVTALVEIAGVRGKSKDADGAKDAWNSAVKTAKGLEGNARVNAVEAVLRGKVCEGEPGDAITLAMKAVRRRSLRTEPRS